MKDGALDIPALKFAVVYNIKLNKEKTNINFRNSKYCDFEDVDGLTLRQIYDILNCGKEESTIVLCPYVVHSNLYDNSKKFLAIKPMYSMPVYYDDLDTEISVFFEKKLIEWIEKDAAKSIDSSLNFGDMVATFLTRYRNRNDEYINTIVLKKTQKRI